MPWPIVACALAADAPAPSPAVDPAKVLGLGEGVRATADLGVWLPRLTGTAWSGGMGGTQFALDSDLGVQDQAVGFAGEFAIGVDRWRFGGMGFQVSANGSSSAAVGGSFAGVAVSAGDVVSGSYDAWMAGGEVGYVLWRPFADQPWPWSAPGDNRAGAEAAVGRNGRPLADIQVFALAGGLAFQYEQQVTNVTAGGNGTFGRTIGAAYGGVGLDIRAGLDGRVPLVQDIRIYGHAGFGGGWPDAGSVWMIRVGIAAMLLENVGVEFGYRLFDFDLTQGDSQVDAGLRGLFAAVSLRF